MIGFGLYKKEARSLMKYCSMIDNDTLCTANSNRFLSMRLSSTAHDAALTADKTPLLPAPANQCPLGNTNSYMRVPYV